MIDSFFNIIFIFFLLSAIIPVFQRRMLAARRLRTINQLEKSRGTRVITMIHRQEALSFLGIPLMKFIDIEESERILRAIRLTDPEVPIDIILHTPGGLVLAADQIAAALARRKGKVTAFVPHYAMSGGTMIALAASEIVMDPDAMLGPVDPQIGDTFRGTFPATSIVNAMRTPNPNRDDHTLILADVAAKALKQQRTKITELLVGRMGEQKAGELADALGSGQWTHDYPISATEALSLGLPITVDMPREIYALMDLYPQAPQRRPSVEYIPLPYPRPEKPGKN